MEDARKKRIVTVAARKFNTYGLRRVTMDDIARELGMSKKTLYKYFRGKEQLVDEYVSTTAEKRIGEVVAALESADSASECFGAVYKLIVSFSATVSKPFLNDLRVLYPQIWERVHRQRSEGLRKYADLIRRGIQQGQIRSSINPDIATEIIRSVIDNYMVPETFIDGRDPREVAQTWFTMLTGGLFFEPPELTVDEHDDTGAKKEDVTVF